MASAKGLLNQVKAVLPEITAIRRDLHAHPELNYRECRTAQLVSELLTALDFEVRTQVGSTGVVGLLRGGKPGKVVALRADMDALPIQEESGVSHASQVPGLMHACGHDGHTACLLGVARVLANHRKQLRGAVKFIFQPAEEAGAGAERMIAEGVLENPEVEGIFALHSWPDLPPGTIGVKYGVMMASTDLFRVAVTGKGAHGAKPHEGLDPIVAGANVIVQLQSIVSRQRDPVDPVVLTVGKVHGGTAPNVIPDRVEMEGTLRTLSERTREAMVTALRRVASRTCEAHGARAHVRVIPGYPVTVNDDGIVTFVAEVARDLLGEAAVETLTAPSMGGEDFSYYLQRVPGCMFRLGIGEASGHLHSPKFDFNDEALQPGILLLSGLAMEFLSRWQGGAALADL